MASQFPIRGGRKLSKYVPALKDQGIDYVAAAAKAGVGIQAANVTQSGSTPFAVTFAGLGLQNMADATYDVIVSGPTGGTCADYTTRTTTGFNIINGTASDRIAILVVGRLQNESK